MSTGAPETPPPPSHGWRVARVIASHVLVVIATLLVVVSILANFVKREALDSATFKDTSRELIANTVIQDEIANRLVDEIYANVDVSQALAQRLPGNLQPLAGPIAGATQQLFDRAAHVIVQRPRFQNLFVEASSLAQ